MDGSGAFQVVILGDAELDVADLDPSTLVVRGAGPGIASIEDVDGDLVDDLLVHVAAQGLGGAGNGSSLRLVVAQYDSRLVIGEDTVTWTPTMADADGDGVANSCDLCPLVAAPIPDADGCP